MAVTSVMTIPTNVGPSSYSGMGSGWEKFLAQNAMPTIANLLSGYADLGNRQYGEAIGEARKTFDTAGSNIDKFYQSSLGPATQAVLNRLASRGMITSSVAGDALSKAITSLGTSAIGAKANLESNEANTISSLLGNRAAFNTSLPNFVLNLANLGRYSSYTDTSAPYNIMAQLLSRVI